MNVLLDLIEQYPQTSLGTSTFTQRFQTDNPAKFKKVLLGLSKGNGEEIKDSMFERTYSLNNPKVNVIIFEGGVEIRGKYREVVNAIKFLSFHLRNSGIILTNYRGKE